MTTAAPGPVSAHIRDRVNALLREPRVVVWYDSQRDFADLLRGLEAPRAISVSAGGSPLQARRSAESAYRRLNGSNGGDGASPNVLIYDPASFEMTTEARR